MIIIILYKVFSLKHIIYLLFILVLVRLICLTWIEQGVNNIRLGSVLSYKDQV
jgi:uncharacterized protein YggT (Ycf19 family)